MTRLRALLAAVLSFMAVFAATPQSTHASRAHTSGDIYCDGVQMSGTATTPYVGLQVKVNGVTIIDSNSTLNDPRFYAHVKNGTFSFIYRFTTTYAYDTSIQADVYGSTRAAPNNSDGQIVLTVSDNCDGIAPPPPPTSQPVPLAFSDGRCNQDADQTVAVYPDWEGGYYFYAVYQGIGYFAFHMTEQQLDNNPAQSADYLIAHKFNVWLYRKTDGTLFVTGIKPDGKLYTYDIGSCGAIED